MSVRAAWQRYFENFDVFLCPTNFTPAFAHDQRPFDERTITTPEGEQPYTNQPFWITHASLPGLPALVAPIGRGPERAADWRADHCAALRGRHRTHLRRATRRL